MALKITGAIVVQRPEHGNRRPLALYAMAFGGPRVAPSSAAEERLTVQLIGFLAWRLNF
jgi:hypothetical protein